MVIEEALVAHLLANAGVIAYVGNRIYPLVIPEGVELPAIAYQRISTPRESTHSGPSGLASPRFQFSCVSGKYSEANGLVNAVRRALDGYKGTMGGVNGINVGAVFVENTIDESSGSPDLCELKLDAVIWHDEV